MEKPIENEWIAVIFIVSRNFIEEIFIKMKERSNAIPELNNKINLRFRQSNESLKFCFIFIIFPLRKPFATLYERCQNYFEK